MFVKYKHCFDLHFILTKIMIKLIALKIKNSKIVKLINSIRSNICIYNKQMNDDPLFK